MVKCCGARLWAKSVPEDIATGKSEILGPMALSIIAGPRYDPLLFASETTMSGAG